MKTDPLYPWRIFIYDADGNRWKMEFSNFETGKFVLDEIKKRAPYSYYGYINEYDIMYKTERDKMLADIDRKRRFMGQISKTQKV